MNNRRRVEGVVTSNKMQKTVIVQTTRTFRHARYGKVVNSHHKLVAHDEMEAKMGDEVRLVESRPLSKTKRWVVEAILNSTAQDKEAK